MNKISKIQKNVLNTTFKRGLMMASFLTGTYVAARFGLFGKTIYQVDLTKDQEYVMKTSCDGHQFSLFYNVKIKIDVYDENDSFNKTRWDVTMTCIRPVDIVINRSPWRENKIIKVLE
jgi:hypothetical protein